LTKNHGGLICDFIGFFPLVNEIKLENETFSVEQIKLSSNFLLFQLLLKIFLKANLVIIKPGYLPQFIAAITTSLLGLFTFNEFNPKTNTAQPNLLSEKNSNTSTKEYHQTLGGSLMAMPEPQFAELPFLVGAILTNNLQNNLLPEKNSNTSTKEYHQILGGSLMAIPQDKYFKAGFFGS
jgi:hypothetical protein